MLEHLKGLKTPAEAKEFLEHIGVEESSYPQVLKGHPVLDGLSGHDHKALVTIARSDKPLDYSETYFLMKEKYPQK